MTEPNINTNIPKAMIKAAVTRWKERANEHTKSSAEEHVKAILTAALSVCQVQEQWYVTGQWEDGEWWRSRAATERHAHEWATERQYPEPLYIAHELIITTPMTKTTIDDVRS